MRLTAERRTAIRCHRDVDDAVKEMTDAIDKSGKRKVLVSLDTEKELSTLQTSIFIPNYLKEGRKYEKNILFQIKSVREIGRNIFKEGMPVSLRNFLCDLRLTFIGRAIKGDIKYLQEAFSYEAKRSDALLRILSAMIYPQDLGLLSSEKKVGLQSLVKCRNSNLDRDFVDNQFDVRFAQRGAGFQLQYTPAPIKAHHSRPFKNKAAMIAKGECTSKCGENDDGKR